MNLVFYLLLSFLLPSLSEGFIEHAATAMFDRKSTNGKLESIFHQVTTFSKIDCARFCQNNQKCLYFSAENQSSFKPAIQSAIWFCEFSKDDGFTSDSNGVDIYKHTERECVSDFDDTDQTGSFPVTPEIVNIQETLSASTYRYTFPNEQPHRTSTYVDIRANSNLLLKFNFENDANPNVVKIQLKMMLTKNWNNLKNNFEITGSSVQPLPDQPIVGTTFKKRIWVSIHNGYISFGRGENVHEDVVLNVSHSSWSTGDYLRSVHLDALAGGSDFEATIYSRTAMINLPMKTTTFPASNIDFEKAFDSNRTTEIQVSNYNQESILSINTTELQEASYVQIYTDWNNCSITCHISIYSSERIDGSTNAGYCYYLSSELYDTVSARCTYMCVCPPSGCQYTIIKYKAPISIATKEIYIY